MSRHSMEELLRMLESHIDGIQEVIVYLKANLAAQRENSII